MAFLGIDYFDDRGKYIFLVKKDLYKDAASFKPNDLNDRDIIILSATEDFSRTDTTSISEYPVSSGSRHTDHYSINPATVNFRGVIAPKLLTAFAAIGSIADNGVGFDTFDNLKSPVTNYLKKVRDIMLMSLSSDNKTRNSPLFTAYLPDGNTIETCVITSFSISRDAQVSDGYYVDITVQEVFFADTKYSVIPLNDKVTDAAPLSSDSGNNWPESKIQEKGLANQNPLPGVSSAPKIATK